MINNRILLVDDEPNVVESFRRHLRREFEVETALSGDDALKIMEVKPVFSVIVSDFQMPGMNGVEFFQKARTQSPNTVRIMLTGQADMETVIDAFNNGDLFKFLTKPCAVNLLSKAIHQGIHQYNLVTAEKELLGKTLSGSIRVMTEILSLVNPTAFGRGQRIRKFVNTMVTELGVSDKWQFELAALLSQIGFITIPEEIMEKIKTP